jgi:hypothetical protein
MPALEDFACLDRREPRMFEGNVSQVASWR